jgi:hypothetical protein
MVVVKLLPDPSADVAAEDSVLEAATSEVDEGNDCPLAGIGMTLVEIALVAAAKLVCDA